MVIFPFNPLSEFVINGYRTRDGHLIKKLQGFDKNLIVIYRPLIFWKIIFEFFYLRRLQYLRFQNGVFFISISEEKYVSIIPISFRLFSVFKLRKKVLPLLYKDIACFCSKIADEIKPKSSLQILHFSPLSINASAKIDIKKIEILDGIDNLMLHPTYQDQELTLQTLYCKAIEQCTLVQFNSKASVSYFREKFKSHRRKITYSRNGVDLDKFDNKQVFQKLKVDLLYIGKIQEMFDVELVEFLASSLPHRQFHIVGPVLKKNHLSALKKFKNINIVGNVSHDIALAYYKSAKAFFIPYDVKKQHGGDPIKFYEAYVSNLPIITTDIGDVNAYETEEGIFIARSYVEFLAGISRSEICLDTIDRKANIKDLSWNSIAEKIANAY